MTSWSDYQKAVFTETAEGNQHCIIEAKAGSGKTTTLIESINHIPEKQSWLLAAFNKKIAEELKIRAPSDSGSIYTLHALGLKHISNSFPNITINQDKLPNIVERVVGNGKELFQYRSSIAKTVALAKANLAKTDIEIDDIIDEYDIDLLETNREEFIQRVLTCLDLCKAEIHHVDFDDMCWFPNIFKLKLKKYDTVLIDEYQDLNVSQIKFALQLCKKKGRVFCYGDEFQAIYNFRGANSKSVAQIIKALSPKLLPLSISYRCPVNVIVEAQKYVHDIQAAPGAPMGEVHTITETDLYKIAKPGCFIISRTNAPMLNIALKFIQNGVPANIRGRDIGANLLNFIQNSKAKSIVALKEYADKWREKEVARLVKKQKDVSVINDKWECVNVLIDGCKEVEQVKVRMHRLFSDENDFSKILLTSTHRVKGDQNHNVFVLWSTYFGDDDEARNLRYVAVTRSQDKLYYVKSPKKEKKEEDEPEKQS